MIGLPSIVCTVLLASIKDTPIGFACREVIYQSRTLGYRQRTVPVGSNLTLTERHLYTATNESQR